MCVLGRTENLILVLAERRHPRPNVRGVLLRFMRDTALGSEKNTGDLCPELLLGIARISEPIAFIQRRSIQTRRMSAPVRELVQSRPVVIGWAAERVLRRQMDRI